MSNLIYGIFYADGYVDGGRDTLQREIKELEKRRNEMRQKLYKSQDEVDEKKENLLDKVEAQLNQKITRTNLFAIQYKVI